MQAFFKYVVGAAAALMLPQLVVAAPASTVLGWEEQAALLPEQTVVKIQLDTSAENSSLAAVNIVPFDKGSEKWVRFSVQVPKGLNGDVGNIPFERKILRTEKGKGGIGGGGHRQVVKMDVCIGDQAFQEELTLKSPGKKDYVVILGRSSLQHIGVVSSSISNTVKPACSVSAAKQAS